MKDIRFQLVSVHIFREFTMVQFTDLLSVRVKIGLGLITLNV